MPPAIDRLARCFNHLPGPYGDAVESMYFFEFSRRVEQMEYAECARVADRASGTLIRFAEAGSCSTCLLNPSEDPVEAPYGWVSVFDLDGPWWYWQSGMQRPVRLWSDRGGMATSH